jgi:hypothetical protein
MQALLSELIKRAASTVSTTIGTKRQSISTHLTCLEQVFWVVGIQAYPTTKD